MKRDRRLVLVRGRVPRRERRLTSDLLAASYLTPLPTMRWHKPVQRGSLAGLVVMAAWLAAPPRAAAQTCTTGSETYSCSIAAGTYTSAVSVNAPTGSGDGNALQTTVTSQGAYTVTVPASQGPALSVKAAGQNGSSNGNAGNGQGITINTQGNLTLTDTSWSGDFLFGLYASLYGGNGWSSTGDAPGGAGGWTGTASLGQILSLTNSGSIAMDLPSVTVGSGAALYAITQGGTGGTGDKKAGGAGGQATGATVDNSGAISVTGLQGSNGFAGIAALGFGGNAGATGNEGGGAYGGAGGPNSVTNSGAVTVDWSWNNVSTPTLGVYGILAQSTGGNGSQSNESGSNGGDGGYNPSGAVHTASVSLAAGGDVKVTSTGSPAGYAFTTGQNSGFNGAGVASILIGGNGGDLQEEEAHAGNAGWAGTRPGVLSGQITVVDAGVTTSGDNLPALLVLGQGGNGGTGLPQAFTSPNYREASGGEGGFAGDSRVQVTASTKAVTISTAGTNSAGVVNWLQGGVGGNGGWYTNVATATISGAGGNGGDAGQVSVNLQGKAGAPIGVITTGDNSAGIQAISQGGAGGNGGDNSSELGSSRSGNGGAGGHSWDVNVSLVSTSIGTSGNNSPGIFAESLGAAGGSGGSGIGGSKSVGGTGGAGGYSTDVTVTLDGASSISTQGSESAGIVAQTVSGAGGVGGTSDGIFKAVSGNGGVGGNTGNITITNDGSITTSGGTARGIVALAMSGVGGTGGSTYGVVYTAGGQGSAGGTVGTVTIANTGSIATEGSGAKGILGQSLAGGGGAGGDASGTVVSIGGNASTNPFAVSGNTVSISHGSGSIATTGLNAIGILGQSIGGGGGDGGTVSDGTFSIGGSGGAGGAGGSVVGNVDGKIATSGDGAHAIAMQSIGGGGGNGGNATADSIFEAYSVGGTGGSGGNGGPAVINMSNGTITTTGSKAAALVVQSIGGGGGTGGQAISGSVGAGFSTATAIGGSGGSGGQASQVSSQMVGGSIATGQTSLLGGSGPSGSCTALPCNQLPVDAYGVVVQSIGGGGGTGGSASAKALAIAIPVTPDGDQIGVSAGSALGGSGGSGGSSDYVTFAVSQGGTITTNGQGSTGVLLQSIGGGGGAGGDSSALAAVIGYGTNDLPDNPNSLSVDATFSVGGTGGSGGNGGPAYMALGGLISVSGSGAVTFTPDAPGSPKSSITTYGDFANGVKAQSIGGGGGDAGFGSGNTQDFGTGTNLSLNVTVGAEGGGGGTGGEVIVGLSPTSSITTWGSNAMGVVAQSIGGGGGTSSGGSYSFGGSYSNLSPTVTTNVGRTGGSGGTGGDVTVDVQGTITTHGGDAAGVLAQSIGGSGGVGGSAGSDASADNPFIAGLNARQFVSNVQSKSVSFDMTSTVAVGGTGGSGNTGGTVAVDLSSTVATSGDWASGIVAQSIGGGGGKAGTAAATGTGQSSSITINHNIAVGGTGGTGGNGGAVNIGLGSTTAGSTIATAGFGASAVMAQSVGGGGGMAADGSDGAWGNLAVGTAASGQGGAGGNGGNVTLVTTGANTIMTKGEAADGVVLQSVGGGGGLAGSGSSAQLSVGPLASKTRLSGGGGPGASGAGGSVSFTDDGTIAIGTSGNNAFGIVAQSVGGGGGIVKTSQAAIQLAIQADLFSTQIGGDATGGQPNNNGGQVSVTLDTGSKIVTSGSGAHGIIAQSIGGGGGIVGLPGTAPVLTTTAPSGDQTIANGNGNTVTVTNGAAIQVIGAGSIGILAQSVGSGGGLLLLADGDSVFAGSAAASLSGSGGHGNRVTVSTTGSVTASGTNGIAIFAQSTGHTASEDGPITVNVDAAVRGGSGQGVAVQIDSPTGSQDGTVNVGASGSLQASSGTAIQATSGVVVNVNNQGTIIGQTNLNGGKMNNSGTYSPGPTLQHDVVNSGRLILRRNSKVGNVTITTDSGGITAFLGKASGGKAHYVTNAGGVLDISLSKRKGMTAGSIGGGGTYYLGSKQLTVGADNSSTTVSGVISDGGMGGGRGGSLVKIGRGTLTLTGGNSYTGGTTVRRGVLQGDSTSLQGDIVNNASVVFNQTGFGTYAGTMSGSGSLTLTGGGLLNLTGAHTYTGPTTVSDGILSVNGSLASKVTLLDGGTLGGNGAVASFAQTGGVLSPGLAIGTLTVIGNTRKSAGVYRAQINAQGASDRLDVGGVATISGVTVQVQAESGHYAASTTYKILNAKGGVIGTYAGISDDYAFLTSSLSYDANNVYLMLAHSFAAGAQTSNQYAVAAALDQAYASATGDLGTVFDGFSTLNAQQGAATLNTISGQPIANFGTVNIEGASLFMNALGQQMALARSSAGGGQRLALAEACEIATCEAAASPWSAWGSALGGLGSVLGNGNAGTLTYNFGGAAVGLDYRIDPRFLVGLGVGYAHGTQWTNGFNGTGWTDSVSVAAYASFTQAGFYADALAGYGYYDNKIQRQIIIPGVQRTANGSTGANQFLGQLETGYRLGLWAPAQASITPFARLQGSVVTQNGFSESGAQSLSLDVASQTTSSLRTTFGVELAGAVPLGAERSLDLALRAGWQHEYDNTARPITAALSGAPFAGFTVYGATPARDGAVVGFSAKTRIADMAQLYVRYDGQLGGGTDNHALNLGVRVSW
jgi:hypothetical protein